MNKNYRELKKNTIIIAIASFGSKIISFVLAPLYSYYMTVSEYGTMDIITSTISLMAPFIVLDIFEATFRYSNDKEYKRDEVLSTSLFVALPGIFLTILLIAINYKFRFVPNYFGIVCICMLLTSINSILSQYLRGSSKMMGFAASGIVCTISLLVANYFFLVYLKFGLYGWLYSYFVSRIVEFIYLTIVSSFFKTFSIKKLNKKYLREFIKFCIPLLPTSMMWWIMSLSDRYMLAYFSGTVATGLYAVANKLPNLLSVIENVFYQAWQTTAINTKSDNQRDTIYSNVLNNYITVMAIGILGVLLVGKPMICYLFEKSYKSAYLYVPILVISVALHAVNGNLGSLYTVFKNTKGAFYSTFIGATTNVVLNVLLIPIIGIYGACLTTFIGFFVTLIYRFVDTKKFVSLKIDWINIITLVLLIIIQLVLYYIDGYFSIAIRLLIVTVIILKNYHLVLSMVKKN